MERSENVALTRVNGLQQVIDGGKKREEHLRSALAHSKQRVRKDKKKFAQLVAKQAQEFVDNEEEAMDL